MIPEIGVILLILAMLHAAIYILVPSSGVASYGKLDPKIQLLFVMLTIFCLWYAIFTNDFSLHYVSFHSHSELPWYYKFSSLWSGHEGSLLLWLLIQQIYHCALNKSLHKKNIGSEKISIINRVMHVYSLSILLVICFTSNPFVRDFTDLPIDGADLNPMLQDFALIIHPPILYMGYVGTSSVFALSIAILLRGPQKSILSLLRMYSYISWGFLGLGITLGSWWAYYELGWGGWWFWDPAENAALLPWLSLTAVLHTLTLGSRWWKYSALLAISSFILSLIGTFLIRSGLVSSVHSFALDLSKARALIGVIAVFLGIAVYSFANTYNKSEKTKVIPKQEIYIGLSNLVIVVYMFSIFIGTVYPLITKSVFGYEVSVGFPYFNMLTKSLILPSILIIPYTKMKMCRANYIANAVISCCFSFWLISYFGEILWFAFFVVTSSIFLIICELRNIVNLKRALSHSGLSVLAIAITIVTHYEIEIETPMHSGAQHNLANLAVTLNNITVESRANHVAFVGDIEISNKEKTKKIYPEKRFYFSSNNATTEVALSPSPLYDVYVAMSEKRNDTWIFRLSYKPMVRWLWIGGIIIIISAFFAVFRRSCA